MKKVLVAIAIIGGIIGAFALPFQYYMYEMEAPNLLWIVKMPFLALCFATIASGMAMVLAVLIGGVLELFNDNTHWPHV